MVERFKHPTLLIIADNPSVRYWVKKQLENQFFVIEAEKRVKALETAQHSALEMIIVDAAFEDSDALEVCREVRRTPSNGLTPILLITDRLKKSYRDTALDAGVTDFLFQPLDADELDMRIATAKKTAQVRDKVSDLSSRIKSPKFEPSSTYFKKKFMLHDQALQLLANAKKNNITVTMLVIRVDRFAEIQSKLGYTSAQEVLHAFTNLLERSVGEQDMIIPSSDGQFIILLSGTKLEDSRPIAEKVRKLIERQRFSTKQGPLHLTASFVLSSVESTEKSFNHMIDAATKSLQQSLNLSNQIFLIDKEHT